MKFEDYRDSHKRKGADYDATIFASPFDAHMDRWEAHHLTAMIPRFFSAKVPRYLDFACGTGRITRLIEPLAAETCGVDVSENMLNTARSKCHKARFVCTDLTQGDSELGPYDLVTSFRFFGNAQDELRRSALSAIQRRLRPGGYLIINNHRNPRSLLAIAHRIAGNAEGMDLSHSKLKHLLHRHGFEIVHQRAIAFWIFRSRLMRAELLESTWARKLERAFQHALFVPFAPDALIVARKLKQGS